MPFYKSAEELLKVEGNTLMEIKRTPRSMLGLISCAIISTVVITLILFLPNEDGSSLSSLIESKFILLFYLIPIAFCVEAVRRYHDDLYIFERERIVHKGGRLSLQLTVPSIRYIDIRAVSVNQSIYGRIFGYGSIELNTAAEDISELVLSGVRAPLQLANVIENIRLMLSKKSSAQAGKATD
ncbi:PH domain-containing protein [bacterium]|nr:PH domain-containing protein [bacterium]